MQTIVVDIETVPDYTVWEPEEPTAPVGDPLACEKCGKPISDAEVVADGKSSRKCEKMERGKCRRPKVAGPGDKPFPPLYAHRVVCIGFAVLNDGVPGQVEAVVAADSKDEPELLRAFNNFAKPEDLIVTWAGRRFDLTVLGLRSFKHGVPVPWSTEKHRQRYSEDFHIDLADVMTGHLPDKFMSLDDLGRCMGLRVKNGITGADVAELASMGKWTDIANYCKRDVTATAYAYLRYRLMRGQIDRAGYSAAAFELRKLHTGQEGMDGFVFNDKLLMLEE